MKKKIFITGGKGMLASAIEAFYAQKQDVIAAPTHSELDITDRVALRDAVTSFRPQYLFHTAALHVDACEENPQLAFKINSWASAQLAHLCAELDIILVYISSPGYFGDEIRYYSEYDPVVLKTVYARSKYQGEVLAVNNCQKTFAVRPGWLFGGNTRHKKNFVYQRYLEGCKNKVIKSANDKFGSPTFVDDLVKKIDEIITTRQFGLYHVTNSGGCNRAEYVKKIMRVCNLDTEVIPVNSDSFPRKANVPCSELLSNWNLSYIGIEPLPPWEDAVDRYARIMLKETKGD